MNICFANESNVVDCKLLITNFPPFGQLLSVDVLQMLHIMTNLMQDKHCVSIIFDKINN